MCFLLSIFFFFFFFASSSARVVVLIFSTCSPHLTGIGRKLPCCFLYTTTKIKFCQCLFCAILAHSGEWILKYFVRLPFDQYTVCFQVLLWKLVCASLDDTEPCAKCRWCPLSYQGNFVLELPTDTGLPALSPPVASTFSCTLKFTVRDCDPDSGVPTEEGYEDEYVVSVACTVTWTPLHRWLLPGEHFSRDIWHEPRGFYFLTLQLRGPGLTLLCGGSRSCLRVVTASWIKQLTLFYVFIIGVITRWKYVHDFHWDQWALFKVLGLFCWEAFNL